MLGKRLKKLRLEAGLTQQELAAKLSMSRSTFAQYEVDHRVPEHLTFIRLANFFNVSLDYLVGRELRPPAAVGDIGHLPPEAHREIEEYIKYIRLGVRLDLLTYCALIGRGGIPGEVPPFVQLKPDCKL